MKISYKGRLKKWTSDLHIWLDFKPSTPYPYKLTFFEGFPTYKESFSDN